MKPYYYEDLLEAGVDEVARGCLAGPVVTAAVVWPKELDPEDENVITKDSKKYSARKRLILKDYIEEHALDFSVNFQDAKVIDKINILAATMKSMHESIKGLNIEPEHLLIDGPNFKHYFNSTGEQIPHTCIVNGDASYLPIACASILAKVYHDKHIEDYCEAHPEYDYYDWRSNMCYGTKTHLDAIKKHGTTPFHRKTFGICREY
jgi:ribonuclease HII